MPNLRLRRVHEQCANCPFLLFAPTGLDATGWMPAAGIARPDCAGFILGRPRKPPREWETIPQITLRAS
jgi:hypothetical protein